MLLIIKIWDQKFSNPFEMSQRFSVLRYSHVWTGNEISSTELADAASVGDPW